MSVDARKLIGKKIVKIEQSKFTYANGASVECKIIDRIMVDDGSSLTFTVAEGEVHNYVEMDHWKDGKRQL